MHSASLACAAVVTLLAGACSGRASEQSRDGGPAPTTEGPRQPEIYALPDLAATCDASPGLTGRQVIDALADAYDVSWEPREERGGADAPATVRFVYDGGPITCHTAWGGLSADRPEVDASLAVALTMAVVSSDGVLQEKLTATIRRKRYSRGMSFDGSLIAAARVGTLALDSVPEGAQLVFEGSIDSGVSGNLYLEGAGQRAHLGALRPRR
jgi:hypothetical protein